MTTTNPNVRLIIIFGGQSAERDVSCLTAAHVLRAVDATRYEIQAIGIDKSGQFVSVEVPAIEGPDVSDVEIAPLVPVGGNCVLSELLNEPSNCADTVVLPLLHGPLGEDGTIQGLLEMANVAYVGAGVLGSAATMDKAMAKTVLDAHDIPQTKWLSFVEHQKPVATMATEAIDALGLPCFVKPANMGSSIGVSKAETHDELIAAFSTAFRYDEVVVVEEAVLAREIEFAVLGNADPEISVPGEIKPAADFYDYEDKYFDGAAELQIPASLPAETVEQMRSIALSTYRALRVEGMARADFLFEENGRGPLLNELNTIPGFTPISMYPKLWEASGLAYSDLIDKLVELALQRHKRRATKRAAS